MHILGLLLLPKMLWDMVWKGKYRKNFFQRLGKGFPHISPQESAPIVWIHAVSLGETKALIPLIRFLKHQVPSLRILLSSTTETGHHFGCTSIPEAEWHVYLPFDLRYVICPLVRRVSPALVILMETDFWYHFQTTAKQCGASLVIVNGKLSLRSFRRFSKIPFLSHSLFAPFDLVCVQAEIYKTRFRALGVAENKLLVTGNLKLNGAPNFLEKTEYLSLQTQFGLEGALVFTLGSTHDPEESLWISALKEVWKHIPNLKVFLAPRHPERIGRVAQLLQQAHVSYVLWSDPALSERSNQVILVDQMGVLPKCYQLSDVAFVGGSLTPKVGGHHILEPCFYGKPVLYGPYLHTQADFLACMQRYDAGIEVVPETLTTTLESLLTSPQLREEMGKRGLQLIEQEKGALEKTAEPILSLLKNVYP